jgi:hypothetical protein
MQYVSSIEVSLFSKSIDSHVDEVVSSCSQFTNSIAGSNRDFAFATVYEEQFSLPLYRGIGDIALEKSNLNRNGYV